VQLTGALASRRWRSLRRASAVNVIACMQDRRLPLPRHRRGATADSRAGTGEAGQLSRAKLVRGGKRLTYRTIEADRATELFGRGTGSTKGPRRSGHRAGACGAGAEQGRARAQHAVDLSRPSVGASRSARRTPVLVHGPKSSTTAATTARGAVGFDRSHPEMAALASVDALASSHWKIPKVVEA